MKVKKSWRPTGEKCDIQGILKGDTYMHQAGLRELTEEQEPLRATASQAVESARGPIYSRLPRLSGAHKALWTGFTLACSALIAQRAPEQWQLPLLGFLTAFSVLGYGKKYNRHTQKIGDMKRLREFYQKNDCLPAGTELPDGTIYIGKVEGQHWATTPKIHPRRASYQDAKGIVRQLAANNHMDWELPDPWVGRKMWETRNEGKLKNSFDHDKFPHISPCDISMAIWLSVVHHDYPWCAWGMKFNGRLLDSFPMNSKCAIRPVRKVDTSAILSFLNQHL